MVINKMAIVNNKHKFIYMHPQKCAGGTLSNILQRAFPDTNLKTNNPHPTFSSMALLAKLPLEQYFKFAVTRNTWDRVVSMYFHVKKHQNYTYNFDRFVFNFLNPSFSMHQKLTYQNKYIIDYVIRFDHLAEDVKIVMNRLDVYNYKLEHVTHNTGRPTADYRSYYNEQTKNHVYNIFKWEIDTFNYEF